MQTPLRAMLLVSGDIDSLLLPSDVTALCQQRIDAAGSCLVLKGNGADIAMHCVPPVQRRRMSITLRK